MNFIRFFFAKHKSMKLIIMIILVYCLVPLLWEDEHYNILQVFAAVLVGGYWGRLIGKVLGDS
jgi:hypothetical protein